jgi:hypothetical protein
MLATRLAIQYVRHQNGKECSQCKYSHLFISIFYISCICRIFSNQNSCKIKPNICNPNKGVHTPKDQTDIGWGWIDDIHGRGLGGYILKTVSERCVSIKIEEQLITPTTPIPPVQGGRSPKGHWDKGQGWIPEGQDRGVRGSISKHIHNAIWDSNIQEKHSLPLPLDPSRGGLIPHSPGGWIPHSPGGVKE